MENGSQKVFIRDETNFDPWLRRFGEKLKIRSLDFIIALRVFRFHAHTHAPKHYETITKPLKRFFFIKRRSHKIHFHFPFENFNANLLAKFTTLTAFSVPPLQSSHSISRLPINRINENKYNWVYAFCLLFGSTRERAPEKKRVNK